jgi:hypothetical protein
VNGTGEKVDRDALLAALVLAPSTFARNRFFALYTEPWARRTRSRAAQVRTVVRHFAAEAPRAVLRELLPLEDGAAIVRYAVPDLHFERTAIVDALELAVVRFALARRPRAPGDPLDSRMLATDEDRQRVERALAKLSEKLSLASVPDLSNSSLPPPPTTGDS